jgi:hypothetical protein
MAPIASVSTSISPTVAVAASAIRSWPPLIEYSTRTSGIACKTLHHGRHLLGPHGQHDVRADAQALPFVIQAHGVPTDHTLGFEPRNAILHRGARQTQLSCQLRGRGPRILAQQGQQGFVGIRLSHFAMLHRRIANSAGRSGQNVTTKCPETPDNAGFSQIFRSPAMNLIDKLAPLRAHGGTKRTTGLGDATVQQLAASHPDLVQAIDAAVLAYGAC